MDQLFLNEIKQVIINSIGSEISFQNMNPDFQLVGNVLDSMSVTNLILGLEEHFNFLFNDDELSEEIFKTVGSLADFIKKKIMA